MKTKIYLVAMLVISILVSVVAVPAATASSDPLNVVALGDSYTAGNGAGNYYGPSGCYRSHNNYAEKFANSYRGTHSVSMINLACSSAVSQDIPKQVAENSDSVSKADVVFLSIGGNDGGFANIVVECVAIPAYAAPSCVHRMESSWAKLDSLVENVRIQLVYLDSIMKPSAKLVLVGYPQLLADCDLKILVLGTQTNQPYYYNVSFELRQLQDQVNSLSSLMVGKVNNGSYRDIEFVSLRDLYSGHEQCTTGESWINPILGSLVPAEYFHPKAIGHTKTAQLLVGMNLVNDKIPPVSNIPPPAPSYQLPPPSSGQPVYSGLPFECGVIVPFASTYDDYNYKGTVFHHKLSIDLPMQKGVDVIAPEAGIIYTYSDPAGYGNYVDLHGASGVIHRMAHLDRFAVSNGVHVSRTQTVGYVGTTGASTGPHLHYEQRNSSGQVAINIGGPALKWGPKQGASGFRVTINALVSGNCGAGSRSVYEDIITLSYNHFAYGRSDGYNRNGWGTVKQNVFVPTSVDSCDFDNDGYDEYIVLDASTGRIMMGDPKGSPNGHFYWRQIGRTTTARKIVCGDWNNDGFDDVMMHNTRNVIYFGRSNGRNIVGWKVARLHAGGRPTYWDMCDINGDGRDDLVTYHAGSKRFLVGYRARGVTMNRKQLVANVNSVGGFTCGNFTRARQDEIIFWNAGWRGRYILARFNSAYARTAWYALSPHGLSAPYHGEIAAGDIDGDGIDEFLVNIYKPASKDYSIMVGDMRSAWKFRWYPFKTGMQASYLAVGEFVK